MRVVPVVLLVIGLLSACGGGSGGDGAVDVAGGTDDGGEPPLPTTVDQFFDPSANLTVNLAIGADDYAQTFTVGRSGTLQSVDVMLSNPIRASGTLRVDVRTTTAGAPDEDDNMVLASRDIDGLSLSALPAFVTIDVSGFDIPAVPGAVLAIVVRRLSGDPFVGAIHGTTLEQYAMGAAFSREPLSTFDVAFDGDFALVTRVVSGP